MNVRDESSFSSVAAHNFADLKQTDVSERLDAMIEYVVVSRATQLVRGKGLPKLNERPSVSLNYNRELVKSQVVVFVRTYTIFTTFDCRFTQTC